MRADFLLTAAFLASVSITSANAVELNCRFENRIDDIAGDVIFDPEQRRLIWDGVSFSVLRLDADFVTGWAEFSDWPAMLAIDRKNSEFTLAVMKQISLCPTEIISDCIVSRPSVTVSKGICTASF